MCSAWEEEILFSQQFKWEENCLVNTFQGGCISDIPDVGSEGVQKSSDL